MRPQFFKECIYALPEGSILNSSDQATGPYTPAAGKTIDRRRGLPQPETPFPYWYPNDWQCFTLPPHQRFVNVLKKDSAGSPAPRRPSIIPAQPSSRKGLKTYRVVAGIRTLFYSGPAQSTPAAAQRPVFRFLGSYQVPYRNDIVFQRFGRSEYDFPFVGR